MLTLEAGVGAGEKSGEERSLSRTQPPAILSVGPSATEEEAAERRVKSSCSGAVRVMRGKVEEPVDEPVEERVVVPPKVVVVNGVLVEKSADTGGRKDTGGRTDKGGERRRRI